MKKTEKTKGKERGVAEKKRNTLYIIAGVCICVIVAAVLFFAISQPVAKTGDTVSVLYIGTLENGSVFDSNVNKTALTFTIGAHTVIPGFEDAVVGMKKDQVKTVDIPVDRAYGPYRADLVLALNRSLFSTDTVPEAGKYYSMINPNDGTTNYVKVIKVNDDTITIDENHMLAGQNLTFTIRLVGITEAK